VIPSRTRQICFPRHRQIVFSILQKSRASYYFFGNDKGRRIKFGIITDEKRSNSFSRECPLAAFCARGECADLIAKVMEWPDACSPAPRMATKQSLSIREGSQGEGMPCASRNAILTEYSRPRISLFCILFSPALAAYARIRFFFNPPARASARMAFDSRRLLRAFVVCFPRPWCGQGSDDPRGRPGLHLHQSLLQCVHQNGWLRLYARPDSSWSSANPGEL